MVWQKFRIRLILCSDNRNLRFCADGTLTGNVTKMITPFLVMVVSFNVTGLVRSKKYNGSGKIMSVVGLILPVISIVILMFLLG